MSSRIPNYNLERGHRELLLAQNVRPITFFGSLHSLALRLWDEEHEKLVGDRKMRRQRRAQKKARTSPTATQGS